MTQQQSIEVEPTPPPPDLALVVHSLSGGGAESLAATHGNHWVQAGGRFQLLTFDLPRESDYELSPDVQRVSLDLLQDSSSIWQALTHNRNRIRTIRRAIEQANPQVVLSITTVPNILTLLACRPLNIPVIVSEHIDPQRQPLSRIWRSLRKLTYPRAAGIVVETAPVAEYYRQITGSIPVQVIPNPVQPPTLPTADAPRRADGRHTVIGMGRLVPQKGFDLLIATFAELAARHPNWDLKIIGGGESEQSLRQQIAATGLESRIELCGWLLNPTPQLAQSDLFVFSSRFEGFGIALMDAMACGRPVISFDCPHGPAEIIRHDVDGLLVPAEDVAALEAAMDQLMSSPEDRQRLGQRAPDVLNRFGNQAYFAKWHRFLNSVRPS